MKCHLSGLWSENGGYNASELRIATTLLIPLLQSWFKYQNNQQGPQFPKSSTSEKVAWDWFCGRVSRTSEEFWYACLLMTEFDVLSWLCGWFCRFDLWQVSMWKEFGMFIMTRKGFHIKKELGNVYYDKVPSSWGAPVQWTGRSENWIHLLTSCAVERMFNLFADICFKATKVHADTSKEAVVK